MSEAKRRKIMVVDSDMLQVIEVEAALVEGGYEVVNLTTANGVFAQVEYENPDVLLLEIEMEGLNTHDLFESLRCSTIFEDIVVILYSNMESKRLEEVCSSHDLNGYYHKEMGIEKLAPFIEKFFT